MSSTQKPTIPPLQLTSDQLTVIVASFSSLVFFVVIVVLLSFIYRKDPQCCRVRSCQQSHVDMDAAPQYYSSRQMLVGGPCLEQSQALSGCDTQAGPLFYVSRPSSYSLPSLEGPLPRLPSYESVRKKDRQRQIHMMIADRFGLNGPIITEPPPTYEESILQSMEAPCDILMSSLDLYRPLNIGPTHTSTTPTAQNDPPSRCCTNDGINSPVLLE
ncbi:uncharacterized protein si:ch73-364h19.1 [Lampris incognitus]|uniref:uncharacterized protein si:ch73-364h19.1 n=1 Tax=Lampris incognitus TaxID=2546036 RepID=UPI0024B54EEA|nr:uncharacterized protein si:ch73-364h19.1 [Lampris incognitus]XP_056144493.1 uncharacterized protein si:ch73-364h19.1 [Lampris incognitus]